MSPHSTREKKLNYKLLYSLTKLNSKPMLHLDPPIFP